MQYSDTSANKSGILQECESDLFSDNYGKITGNANLLATFTRNCNKGVDKVSSLIMRNDNSWEFMDSNSTTLPIEDHDLVSGQSDYTLETTHAKVLKVRVKDSNGNYVTLKNISRRDLSDSQLAETGIPWGYDLLGNSVILVGTPNYSYTSGLEIQVQSPMAYFLTTDTTKEPGFPSMFHPLVTLWTKYFYAYPKRLAIAKDLRQEILVMERELEEAMNQRDYGKAKTLSVSREDYGGSALNGSLNYNPKGMS